MQVEFSQAEGGRPEKVEKQLGFRQGACLDSEGGALPFSPAGHGTERSSSRREGPREGRARVNLGLTVESNLCFCPRLLFLRFESLA